MSVSSGMVRACNDGSQTDPKPNSNVRYRFRDPVTTGADIGLNGNDIQCFLWKSTVWRRIIIRVQCHCRRHCCKHNWSTPFLLAVKDPETKKAFIVDDDSNKYKRRSQFCSTNWKPATEFEVAVNRFECVAISLEEEKTKLSCAVTTACLHVCTQYCQERASENSEICQHTRLWKFPVYEPPLADANIFLDGLAPSYMLSDLTGAETDNDELKNFYGLRISYIMNSSNN
ncbi:hypothetical protein RB195_005039 [Necator americanus]|uniref:Uncharacterized protein n=1 Tax=Necator americanus TaxID=51031 RepID=A0ABR1BMS8_NECAM